VAAEGNNEDDDDDADSDDFGSYDTWRYGTEKLPAEDTSGHFGRSALDAQSRYAAANLVYLAGAEDVGKGAGTAFNALDKSCAALLQGPYRLPRILAYAKYDREQLAPAQKRHVFVPGCKHDVAYVFSGATAAVLGSGLPLRQR
jgi:hypothetical protein